MPDELDECRGGCGYEAVGTGQLPLIGADDLDRTVTRPGDTAVGSSGLRLAAPKSIELAIDSVALAATRPGTTAPKLGADVTASSPGEQPDQPVEREIAFSLMTSLNDNDTRDAVRRLLLDLSNAADDGQISWAQIKLRSSSPRTSLTASSRTSAKPAPTPASSMSEDRGSFADGGGVVAGEPRPWPPPTGPERDRHRV